MTQQVRVTAAKLGNSIPRTHTVERESSYNPANCSLNSIHVLGHTYTHENKTKVELSKTSEGKYFVEPRTGGLRWG